MIILHLQNLQDKEKPGVKIQAILGDSEIEQLLGQLNHLAVFATKHITEPATFTKTGATHAHAKYLLLPVKLRRQFKTEQYNYEQLTCGAIHYQDKLYVIYGIPRKGFTPEQKPSDKE